MLDTNIIIFALRHPQHPLNSILAEHSSIDLCISAITYGELLYGVKKSRKPEESMMAVLQYLVGISVFDFDALAAEHFADIIADLERKGKRIGDRDMLIAAHARSLGYTLVTNNVREFERVDHLKIVDWIER